MHEIIPILPREKEGDPKYDTSASSVFGLKKTYLAPIAEALAGEPVHCFEIQIAKRFPRKEWGGHSEPLLVTVAFTTRSGRAGIDTVLAKRFHSPRFREAHHYTWLSSQTAPVPRFYGAVMAGTGNEILFIEPLNVVRDNDEIFLDKEACCEYLKTLARFNATPTPRSVQGILFRQDWALRLGATGEWGDYRGYWPAIRNLDTIEDHALRFPADDKLARLCRKPEGAIDRLRSWARALVEPIGRMEPGLLHDDVRPFQTGWRSDPRELLIFDFEYLTLGPRFHDVGVCLGALEEDSPLPLPREELARVYLDEYARRGGKQVAISVFLHEARLLSFAHRLSVLGAWLAGLIPGEGNGKSLVGQHRDDLVEHLLNLVDHGEQCSMVSV